MPNFAAPRCQCMAAWFLISYRMSDRAKKIFLGICIIVPFFLYCFYYYSLMLKNAPYRFSDFEYIVLKYGTADELSNQFDTRTGVFQYTDSRDSLMTDTIRLRKDDLLYLHRKAAELGFWNLPDDMTTTERTTTGGEVPRFYLQFNYVEKSKEVTLDADYPGNPKMTGTAKSVIDEVRRVMSDAQGRKP